MSYGEYGEEARRGGGATSGFEPDLTAHEAIVTTITPYRFGTLYLINTNKETRTLKGLFPLLLKRRLFTNFNMFVVFHPPLALLSLRFGLLLPPASSEASELLRESEGGARLAKRFHLR